MSRDDSFEGDLREMIRKKQVVAVVGSGISMATSSKAPTWRELIESGLERCRLLGAKDAWCRAVEGQLKLEEFPDMLLAAAELVHQKLLGHGVGQFARWLRETFEEIEPEDPGVIEALSGLGIPIVTTNYDDLIEKVTGLKGVTWRESRVVDRVMHGNESRVLHLHGHWDDPDSVVLGVRSYEAVKGHEHTQAVMKALGMTKSFLFAGCGDEGLSDPNFGKFLTWLEAMEASSDAEHLHYRFVLREDGVPVRGNLYPLAFGSAYDELAPFLRRLVPDRKPEPRPRRAGDRRGRTQLPADVEEYLDRLKEETETLTLMGMGRSLQVELPIAEAYVPLRTVMARSFETRQTDRFKEQHGEHEEEVQLCEVFGRAAALGLRGIVLLGEPGSGKTTGARQLAWRLASGDSLPQQMGLPAETTPVLLRFRNISKEALGRQRGGLRHFLEEECACEDAPDGMQNPGPNLWNGKAGGVLWILDGLKEVTDPETRKKVSGWVQSALKNRPKDWFLVTCRFQGYFREGVPLGPKFVEFHVRPLDDGQVERFVQDWFGAAYRKLLGRDREDEAARRAGKDAGELLGILARPAHQAGHLGELRTNPLLLTILCIVFHEERKLPTGRAELYAHCVRVLLEYWRRDLYSTELGTALEPYDAEAAQAVLARLGWWMHSEQNRTEAPLEQLAAEAEELSEQQRLAIADMLRDLTVMCDGASRRDGAGFNKIDARIGRDLARAGTLSPRQAALGKKILRKYRRQLDSELYVSVFG